jgi:hypothetical protein
MIKFAIASWQYEAFESHTYSIICIQHLKRDPGSN